MPDKVLSHSATLVKMSGAEEPRPFAHRSWPRPAPISDGWVRESKFVIPECTQFARKLYRFR